MRRPSQKGRWRTALLCAVALGLGSAAHAQDAKLPGAEKTAKTRTLELGAKALQRKAPLDKMDIHLVGFHPMKDRPDLQMEAHHYCRQANQDFAQCVLFDGAGPEARLVGIEYIVSEKLYETLPDAERRFWHPHNAEILSGQLVAPGIPAVAETALMRDKMNSYGKTWHVWDTGGASAAGTALPLGMPMLAWSFNRDGEAKPDLVARRDRTMRIDTAETRRRRSGLQPLARPQSGVDDLKAAFPRAVPIPGVVDKRAAR